MIDSGLSKKQRRDKGMIDQIAATIMLQDYMRGHELIEKNQHLNS